MIRAERTLMEEIDELKMTTTELNRKMDGLERGNNALMAGAEESKRKMDGLERGNKSLMAGAEESKRKTDRLEREIDGLKRGKNALIKREILCAFYTAIGHQSNTPRSFTYEWMTQNLELMQSIFGIHSGDAIYFLRLLDPRSTKSLIKEGNIAAHHHTLAEARIAVGGQEQPLQMFIDLLAERSDEDTDIESAANELKLHLRHNYPKLQEVVELDKPRREQEEADKVSRIVSDVLHHLRYDAGSPWNFAHSAQPLPPPPPPPPGTYDSNLAHGTAYQ
jgi:predicted RNase H-like nuclease (RuvC/YqgF family)